MKLLLRALAICPAQPRYLPPIILGVAVTAGAATGSQWVEVGVLVERNGVGRMGVTENVTAAAAVMSTIEIAECFGTRRLIADGSFRIRLRNYVKDHSFGYCRCVRVISHKNVVLHTRGLP
jgi:hypothetical protein